MYSRFLPFERGFLPMKIIKRSGAEEQFDRAKIFAAITKSNEAASGPRELTPAGIEDIAAGIEAQCAVGGGDPGAGGDPYHGGRRL
ncbi:hypothetical protein GA029_27355 [Bacteroides thetaiotaomicron]|nr:hypothetical protein GA029_27355 [Bacteroides thetaiotaomicron]